MKGIDEMPRNESVQNNNINQVIHKDNNMNSEILRVSIQLPKMVIPCVDDICIITRRNRDCLFSYFIICGLAEFYDETEKIFNFARRIPDFLERLRIGLNQCYGRDFYKAKKTPHPEKLIVLNSIKLDETVQSQFNKVLGSEMQNLEFKLMLPDILMESFTILCEITNRTKETLSKMLIIDQLASIYQNPELIHGYIKDYENLKEKLRIGLNLIFGSNYIKKEMKWEKNGTEKQKQ